MDDNSRWSCEPNGPDVAYMIRTSGPQRESIQTERPFVWPESGYVEAVQSSNIFDRWSGIYGLIDGLGDWNQMPRHNAATWQIVAVLRSEARKNELENTNFAPRGWVVYSGDVVGAMQFIVPKMCRASGVSGAYCDDVVDITTAGQQRCAVSFKGGKATALSAGGVAVVGKAGLASATSVFGTAVAIGLPNATESANAEAGMFGVAASFSKDGRARAGDGGAIVLVEWGLDALGNPEINSTFASKVGENGIKPNTWYKLIYGFPFELPQ